MKVGDCANVYEVHGGCHAGNFFTNRVILDQHCSFMLKFCTEPVRRVGIIRIKALKHDKA